MKANKGQPLLIWQISLKLALTFCLPLWILYLISAEPWEATTLCPCVLSLKIHYLYVRYHFKLFSTGGKFGSFFYTFRRTSYLSWKTFKLVLNMFLTTFYRFTHLILFCELSSHILWCFILPPPKKKEQWDQMLSKESPKEVSTHFDLLHLGSITESVVRSRLTPFPFAHRPTEQAHSCLQALPLRVQQSVSLHWILLCFSGNFAINSTFTLQSNILSIRCYLSLKSPRIFQESDSKMLEQPP